MDQNENPISSDAPSEPPLSSNDQSMSSDNSAEDMNTSESMSSDSQPAASEPQVITPTTSSDTPSKMEPMTGNSDMPAKGDMAGDAKVGKPKRFWRKFAIISAIIVVLIGGSAAAFFTVYLPAQPWYVLDTALKNTLAATNLSLNANANITTTGGMTLKVSSLTAADLNKKTADETVGLTVAGFTIPLELRLVNSNLYFKFGDLSSIGTLASLAGGNLGSLGSTLSPLLQSLSNQWVSVDSTLLDQNKTIKCFLNASWITSAADSNYMLNQYLDQPFFTVKSTANDTLNGQTEDKMSVTMNDNQAAQYVAKLSNLSSSKSFDECTGGAKASTSTTKTKSSLADNQIRPLTIWVNKSTKKIDKVEFATTSQDNKKGTSATLDATFTYGGVNVQAPANAVPVSQLLAELVQNLTKSGNSGALNALNPVLSKL